MTTFSIGELAKQANVGVETVRFYERKGLLEATHRKPSGYRQFDEETVLTLHFIRNAKEAGFSLKEIKRLLELRSSSTATKSEVRQQVQIKVCEIESQISDLLRKKDRLQLLVGKCPGGGSVRDCPILMGLEDHISS
jgi:MerR family transcriptional regulator, copper efflux regulator